MPENQPYTPAPDATLAYLKAQQEAFSRWRSKSKWVAYPVGIVVFIAVAASMSSFTSNGAVGLIGALVAGFVVEMLVEWVVMPNAALPSVRCPFCSNQVPIAEPPAFMKPLVRRRACPSCNRELPH